MSARTSGPWRLALALVAIASACSSSGADSRDTVAASSTIDAGPAAVDDSTRERSRAAALDVRASGCGPRANFGTGTVIDTGVAVTAAHVVAGTTEIRVIDVDGNEQSATVVLFDPDLDIAVLRSAEPVGSPVALRTGADADDRGLITLPRRIDGIIEVTQEEVTVLRTATVETTDIYLDDDVVRPGFEVSGTIEPGNSGSLVTFPDGAAGLIWARSTEREARAWAVHLPDSVVDVEKRSLLTDPVDVGDCVS